ncbi:MAG TPA: hypothetical protein VHB79_05545 [Polyangiaceae bacterium]|nr:hypothetical protein [Polyangiaceae bacterium]
MTLSKYFSALTIFGVLVLSSHARADVPPDDLCMEQDLGKPCQNAMGNGTRLQPGVCTETMCTRATPDGSMSYACNRCVADEGGAGGQPSESGGTSAGGQPSNGGGGSAGAPVNPPGGSAAGGKTNTAGSSNDSKSSDDGGCSLTEARGTGALGSLLVALGVAVAGMRRRRSRAS